MKISTPKSLLFRLITGGTIGVLIALGMFAMLLHLVDVPFEYRPTVKVVRMFTPVMVSTPTIPKELPPPKSERPPVPNVPTIPTVPDDPTTRGDKLGPPIAPMIPWVGPGAGPTLPGSFLTGGTDGDANPRIRIPPSYPPSAEIRGIEGWVRVQFTITETGSVTDARVVAAEPQRVFDDAALSAIARWRYNPRVVNGEPVERVGMQTMIEFQLNE
jgi:protein TonB